MNVPHSFSAMVCILSRLAVLSGFSMLATLLAVIAVCFFTPGLSGGFLFDDRANIVLNASVHLKQINIENLLYAAYSFEPGGSSRPLAMLSFALDIWRAGLDPVAFKITNLTIHGITGFVLALFFRKLLVLARWPTRHAATSALALAFMWCIHPIHVSSVLYVVQRMQTLSTFFLLLALLAYLHMRQLQLSGQRGRLFGMLMVLCWLLAFASKEDAALLPLYLLALELTVLRFRAAQSSVARRLRRVYGALVVAGALSFFFVVVPHFWQWHSYPGRDFSSMDRLLTQGRVLVMYLGQILLPLPGSMTFFYDYLNISRSLWQPWTTLPALLILAGLLVWAWYWRVRRPVFSLGILLFFAGHFMTSNVINLEMAFEHRNHFPLVGILIALGDLVASVFLSLKLKGPGKTAIVAVLLITVGSSTLVRSHIWGDELRLAQYSVSAAPNSERAWVTLCTAYFERSKSEADNPYLELAIETCQQGAKIITDSAMLLSNVVIYKTVQGTVTNEDWEAFLLRLQHVSMSAQNKGILWVMLSNAERNILSNERGILETIEIISSKTTLRPGEHLRVAAYIFNETYEPIKAFAHLQRAVELAPPGDQAIQKMLDELTAAGRQDWVDRLTQVQQKMSTKALIQ